MSCSGLLVPLLAHLLVSVLEAAPSASHELTFLTVALWPAATARLL